MIRAVPAILILAACAGHEPAPTTKAKVVVPLDAAVVVIDAAPEPPTLRLPDTVVPTSYDLKLDVSPELETFTGDVVIHVRVAARTDRVYLHAVDLELSLATWKQGDRTGTLVAPAASDELRAFTGADLQPGDAELHFAYLGHVTRDDPEAVFRQKAGGKQYLYTQSESVFARRILPCFDEPRFKVPWHLTLDVPKGNVAVANSAQVSSSPIDGGRAEVIFAPTGPMPSYLLAFAVGPFAVIDAGIVGSQKIKLRVIVPEPDRERATVAGILAPSIVSRLETYFGSPLPWPKLDLISVPQFFGAMENPGLITFERHILVGKPDDRGLVDRFTKVAAHELAHYWFGDLVTFAWWDDLWLAEAFASWMSDKIIGDTGQALEFARSRGHAMDADDEPSAHPLHRTITSSDDAETRFDAISYDKGAAVLAMFEQFAGEVPFRDGVRAYITAHAGGSATSADLFAAIATSTSPAVATAFTAYVDHAAVPIVDLVVDCEGNSGIVLATSREADRPVPVCVRTDLAKDPKCAMATTKTAIALGTCPTWLVGNANGIGYYRTSTVFASAPLAKQTPREVLAQGDDRAAALGRGELASKAALEQLAKLASDKDPVVQLSAIAMARVIDRVVDDATRPTWSAWLATKFSAPRAGFAGRLVNDALLDLDAIDPAARTVARKSLVHALDRKASPFAIAREIERGQPTDRATFDRALASVAAAPDAIREWVTAVLGGFPAVFAPDLVAFALATDKPAWPLLERLFERGATRHATWTALKPRAAELWAKLSPDDGVDALEAIGQLCDATSRTEIAATMPAIAANVRNGKAALDRALGSIDACIARRTRIGAIALP